MEHDYTIQFEYFRIPNKYGLPKKGKPIKEYLYPYERGKGFAHIYMTQFLPTSKGGRVVCYIANNNTWATAAGIADCSYADNFCYKIGREIALGRAKKQLEKGD